MKTFLQILFLIFLNSISITGYAQKIKDKKDRVIIEYPTPPGGVHLYDNVFMDETEVTNLSYLEYLHYIEKDSSKAFLISQLPDSTFWPYAVSTNPDLIHYEIKYFRNAEYRYYPAVGISYEQAVNFCKWRTAVVNDQIQKGKLGKAYAGLDAYDIQIEYRLPSREEWEFAAAGRLDVAKYPYGLERPIKKKSYTFKIRKDTSRNCLDRQSVAYDRKDVMHRMEFNLLEDYYLKDGTHISCHKDTDFRPSSVFEHPANHLGLYGMIGNISEMIAEKGLSKGGSYKDPIDAISIAQDIQYDSSELWLGFRCLAIVHLKRKDIVPKK